MESFDLNEIPLPNLSLMESFDLNETPLPNLSLMESLNLNEIPPPIDSPPLLLESAPMLPDSHLLLPTALLPDYPPLLPDSPPINEWPGLDDFMFGYEEPEPEIHEVIPDLNIRVQREPRRELTNDQRLEAMQILLATSVHGAVSSAAKLNVANRFNVGIRTIQRLWKRAASTGFRGHATLRRERCGRRRLDFDFEAIRAMDFRDRTTIRSMAFTLNVSRSFLFNKLKEGALRRHSNAVKPILTIDNQNARMHHCLNSLDPTSLPHDPAFQRMENTIHIDEKWFYMTRKTQSYYLLNDEEEPVRNIQSSHFIPKIMFLAVVARPRYDSNGVCTFDGKIGIFPLVKPVTAVRNSQNRPAGTVELKQIPAITRAVIREFMITKVLPSIAAKWPRDSINDTIYIQQDNARTHVPIHDDILLEAIQRSGLNIVMTCQPANSPDLNVLDLGFFRAIQSLQSRNYSISLDDLMAAVDQAFNDFEDSKCNSVFLTLQACMVEILRIDGGNKYKLPHMAKDRLRRLGLLPTVIRCPAEIYANAIVQQAL